MPSNDVRRNLQSNAPHESFWDALGLGIEPFFGLHAKWLRITRRCLQKMRGAICSRTVSTRVSGTPCGSVLSHFCVLRSKSHRITRRCLQTMRGAICSRTVPTRVSGTPWGSVFGRFCVLRSKSHRITRQCLQTMRGAICFPTH